jgi:DNA-binding MarR family transcriptional regulator
MKSSRSRSEGAAQHDEAAEILLAFSRLIRTVTRVAGGVEDTPPMTATQRVALFELGDGGSLRLNDLAERMGVSPPTASRSVDALHELGLVERVPDPHDRRALRIDLTPTGKKLLVERKGKAQAAFAPAVAALSASERRTLARLLRRMADAVRASGIS